MWQKLGGTIEVIDWIILGVYLAGIIPAAVLDLKKVGRRDFDSDDYLWAGICGLLWPGLLISLMLLGSVRGMGGICRGIGYIASRLFKGGK